MCHAVYADDVCTAWVPWELIPGSALAPYQDAREKCAWRAGYY